MPKFEDIIKQEEGTIDEELNEEGEQETESAAAPETEEKFDRRKFKRLTKKDAVSDEEKEAFVERQRRAKLGENEISQDPQLAKEIEQIIETLPSEREKEVVRQHFFEGKTFEEIGIKFGVTRGRIKQIHDKALRLLRHPERMKFLEGIELSARSRERHHKVLNQIVEDILTTIRSLYRGNRELRAVLSRINYFTWGRDKKYLSEVDSETFNKICDEFKAIGDKKEFNKQVEAALK